MNRFLAMLLLTSVGLAWIPAGEAACNRAQSIHQFGLAPAMGVSVNQRITGEQTAIVIDTCTERAYLPLGDGDDDFGVGGGLFPASGVCLPAPSIAHHSPLPNSPYYADNLAGAMVWLAGTDGPVDPVLAPCVGNGIVSDNLVTDPYDCGSGPAGLWDGSQVIVPARVGENVPGAGCPSSNGAVWVFLVYGPVFTSTGPLVDGDLGVHPENAPTLQFMSVPTTGNLWG